MLPNSMTAKTSMAVPKASMADVGSIYHPQAAGGPDAPMVDLNSRANKSEHATCPAGPRRGDRRSMTVKAYEHLLEMDRRYDLVVRSLKALAKYPALRPDE